MPLEGDYLTFFSLHPYLLQKIEKKMSTTHRFTAKCCNGLIVKFTFT